MRIAANSFVIAFLILTVGSSATAQSRPGVDIPYYRAVQLSTALSNEVDSVIFLGDGSIRHRLSTHNMSSNPTRLMSNTNVRKELELDDRQIQRIQEIQKNFSQQLNDGMKQARTGKSFDSKKWNKTLQQIIKERKTAMGAVLLPHQSKRLKQIALQMEMRNKGDVNALVGKQMADELEIDEDQKKHLRKRSAELKKELEQEIVKLKQKYREKLFRELRPSQRNKLKQMIGDKFENGK